MTVQKLTDEQLKSAMEGLPGWTLQEAKLHREYKFGDFAHAIGYITTAAILIEKMDHHPEWSNVYNRVTIDLTTHDAGGITARDVKLASVLEDLAQPFRSTK